MNRALTSWRAAFPLLALCWLSTGLAQELRDPTRPPLAASAATATTVASPTAARTLRLEAVLHSQGRAVAIIDGQLLRVGDWLGNARIAAIGSDAVDLNREGRKVTLRLANQAMKVRRDAPSKDSE